MEGGVSAVLTCVLGLVARHVQGAYSLCAPMQMPGGPCTWGANAWAMHHHVLHKQGPSSVGPSIHAKNWPSRDGSYDWAEHKGLQGKAGLSYSPAEHTSPFW